MILLTGVSFTIANDVGIFSHIYQLQLEKEEEEEKKEAEDPRTRKGLTESGHMLPQQKQEKQ